MPGDFPNRANVTGFKTIQRPAPRQQDGCRSARPRRSIRIWAVIVSAPLVVETAGARLMGERWPGADGAPVAVILHSAVTDRRSWREVAARLAPRVAVITYDRRGFGETGPAAARFSHLDDILALLDAVADGPVWLLGNSAGGGLALDAALAEPDRVAGLVLVAPAVSGAPAPTLDAATERLVSFGEAALATGRRRWTPHHR